MEGGGELEPEGGRGEKFTILSAGLANQDAFGDPEREETATRRRKFRDPTAGTARSGSS